MVDISNVVEKLSQHNLIRPNKIINNYYSIFCPFHNEGNERKASCGVLLRDEMRNGVKYSAGWCHCFTCGYAQPLTKFIEDLLKNKGVSKSCEEWLKENIPDLEIVDYADDLLPKQVMDTLLSKYAVDYISSMQSNTATSIVSEEELSKYRYTVPYMYERGLTDELIAKYDVGFDPDHVPAGRSKPVPCVTFPVRDATGQTLFLVRRSIQGKYFNYPSGVTKPLYGIYELPKECTSVLICESCFNALTAVKYGRSAVALLGTGNSYQIEQLKRLGVQEYIIALDPDAAGRRATEKLKRALSSVAMVWELDGIPEGKDINDLSEEEFNSLELV